MGFMDIAKTVGKAAADNFLDDYARSSRKLGKEEGVTAANNLKRFVDGEVDWNGNPIDRDDD